MEHGVLQGNIAPSSPHCPRQRSKRKQMVWPLRKGNAQGLLGVAKEMGIGKIWKC
jgi:hypothetical protein